MRMRRSCKVCRIDISSIIHNSKGELPYPQCRFYLSLDILPCLLQSVGNKNTLHIHSKCKKVCGTTFSVKKYCGKSAGHFWAILGNFGSFLGHFGHFWAILGHICATLGDFGSFLGHFVAFLEKIAESSIFLRPRWGRGTRF